MTRLAALHARITGDSDGFVQASRQAENAAKRTTQAMGAPGAGGLAAATTRARTALISLSSSPGMRMLPVQLSQVAQQAAASTGVMRALSIQAADIGLAFGAVGAIVGTLAITALPLVIGAFSDAEGATDDYSDALNTLKETQEGLRGTLDILEMDIDSLIERYGVAAATVRGFAIDLANLQYQQAASRVNEFAVAIEDVGQRVINFSRATGQASRNFAQFYSELGITEQEARRVVAALEDLQNAEGIDAQIAASRALTDVMDELGIEATDLDESLDDIQIALLEAGIAGAELERVMASVRDRAAEAASAAAGLAAMTRGDLGALSGLATGDLLPPASEEDPSGFGGGGGGGGGARAQDTFERDLDRLRDQLMTQIETEREMHEERQAMLDEALQRELLSHEEYNDLIERERERHHDAMAQMDVYRYGSGVDQLQTFMGSMATAFASGNEEMMRISRIFGAGEALINAWRTFSQVMSDPSLPWFAKIPAAVSLFGSAVQAVSAIQGAGKGGSGRRSAGGGRGGGGVAGTSGAVAGESSGPQLNRSLTIIGDRFNRAQAIEIAEFMNEGTDDGLVIRGRR